MALTVVWAIFAATLVASSLASLVLSHSAGDRGRAPRSLFETGNIASNLVLRRKGP